MHNRKIGHEIFLRWKCYQIQNKTQIKPCKGIKTQQDRRTLVTEWHCKRLRTTPSRSFHSRCTHNSLVNALAPGCQSISSELKHLLSTFQIPAACFQMSMYSNLIIQAKFASESTDKLSGKIVIFNVHLNNCTRYSEVLMAEQVEGAQSWLNSLLTEQCLYG